VQLAETVPRLLAEVMAALGANATENDVVLQAAAYVNLVRTKGKATEEQSKEVVRV
jgi:hypothetical protein